MSRGLLSGIRAIDAKPVASLHLERRNVTRNAIQPDKIAVPKAPYSPVIVSDDLVYTAGQIAFDADGNMVGDDAGTQTRQVLENVRRCLEAVGCGLDDVIKVNAYLTDLANFGAFNAVYEEYFTAPFPVRTTVEAGLVPGFLVEIDVVARKETS